MISTIRKKYNEEFSQEKYQSVFDYLSESCGEAPTFRVSESPIFVDKTLKEKIIAACDDIIDVLVQPDFKAKSQRALQPSLTVPNEDDHSLFLQVDFGICIDENGQLSPQLIEIQGFPSLYFFQKELGKAYRNSFDIPQDFKTFFNGLDETSYVELLRKAIVGNENPENVILLEIEPHKQNTRIDFYATEKSLGIKILCLSELIKEGLDLFYLNKNGEKIAVKRIYNRIIFDELEKRDDLPRQFNLLEPINATWVGHPNWFSRISKFTLPSIDSQYVPATYFLNELTEIPADLENYVLKPIFSFSGMGVIINVALSDIEAIPESEKHNFILQRKVQYAPVIETPSEPAKCEIRMMFLWLPEDEKPTLINNLVRMSKGEMVGVRYNKNKDWVGGSVAFFEQ